MLVIRRKQIEVFEKSMVWQFVNRMVMHIKENFSKQYHKLGNEKTENLILKGIEKAAVYDVKKEKDVSRFINLMFVFHEDFDSHPLYRWANDILKNDRLTDSSHKMDVLCLVAEKHLPSLVDHPKGLGV